MSYRYVSARTGVRAAARVIAATLTILNVAACSDAASGLTASGAPSVPLRVINGAAVPVSVIIDGATRVTTLAPASISEVVRVPEGARRVELRPMSGASATATLQASAGGTEPVLVAATAVGSSSVGVLVLADTAPIPAPGTSKLRVVHMASKAPPIDVWRKQPDFPTPVRVAFPFLYGFTSGYIQSAPGTWELTVTPTDSLKKAGGAVGLPSELARLSLTTAADRAYTVVLLDAPDGVRLEVIDTP
ncbi:MAG TPA: DUF4397 domain-containing protein [Gemmatimonadaceae bacterium]|nr:DUF4397 domain-containing protein [Gemmatimonadaceae bacterium]